MENILAAIEREISLLVLALTNNGRKLMQDNKRQLAELIKVAKGSSKESESQFIDLKNDLARIQVSYIGI